MDSAGTSSRAAEQENGSLEAGRAAYQLAVGDAVSIFTRRTLARGVVHARADEADGCRQCLFLADIEFSELLVAAAGREQAQIVRLPVKCSGPRLINHRQCA
jgi:hypothetical protein